MSVTAFICGLAGGGLLPGLPWPWPLAQVWWCLLLLAGPIIAVPAVLERLLSSSRPAGSGHSRWRARVLCQPLAWGLLGSLLGLGWSAWQHAEALAARLPSTSTGHAIPVTVRVLDDPVALQAREPDEIAVRFRARIEAGRGRAADWVGRQVQLSWFGAPEISQGETWQVAAVLSGPAGLANPGGFDVERWRLGQGIDGLGHVGRGERVLPATPGLLARYRTRLIEFVRQQDLPHGPVLVAQLVGYGGDIPPSAWAVYRATGTIHLMVISGSHVALAAAIGFALGRWLVCLVPGLLPWLDARLFGAVAGVAVAVLYLGIADGGLPGLRAGLMAVPVLLLAGTGRRLQPWHVYLMTLSLMLLLVPLAVHQQGFWLSFAAVAALIACFSRRRDQASGLQVMIRLQTVMSIVLAPLLVVLTGLFPPLGFVANLVAVPVIGAAVVPLTLLAGLSSAWAPGFAGTLLWLADRVFAVLHQVLEMLAAHPAWLADPGWMPSVIALCGSVLWLGGVDRRALVPIGLALSCSLLPRSSDVPPGSFRLLVLDVGQGDAIVVDTHRHRLLFDAGPAFAGSLDAGAAVVVPGVLATGPPVLDLLLLSHEDLDHVGGASAVRAALPVAAVQASFAVPGGAHCGARSWSWDGVMFELLDPPRPHAAPRNDLSCILLVSAGGHRALLAGDIGRAVEARLLREPSLLAGPLPEVLLPPHHGSGSSSSAAFVHRLRPRHALVSAGRSNRYGHPHPAVVARYQSIGASVLTTAGSGALVWRSDAPDEVATWRSRSPSRDRWPGAPYWRVDASAAGSGGS